MIARDKILMLFMVLLSASISTAQQDHRHRFVKLLKSYQLSQLENELDASDNSLSNTVLLKELEYLKIGVNHPVGNLFDEAKEADVVDSVFYYNYLGRFNSRLISPNDSVAFKSHLKAYELSEQLRDTLLINWSLENLNRFFIKNFKDASVYKKYVNLLDVYKQDDIDNFWSTYYTLVFDMILRISYLVVGH